MRRQRILCAALAAMLLFGSCPGRYVEAAEEKPAQTSEAATEIAQTEKTQTEETQTGLPDETVTVTEEELAQYYGDSVFIGDSIMLGFRNYSAKKDNFVHGIQFLAVGSYSARNALRPVAGNNVHPMYKGKKYQLWDAVPLTGSKRVFILFGMNDIGIMGLEKSRNNYKEVLDKIAEACPDVEIHIISATYTLKNKGKGALNNENIDIYNVMLQEMAEENGWGYIDLCTAISDGEGNLAAEYCSDGFAHLSKPAYAVWEKELIRYADGQLAEEETAAAETAKEAKEETK